MIKKSKGRGGAARGFVLSLLAVGILWGPGWPAASGVSAGEASREETRARPVEGIRDNSFLVEEAYNQEKGVVQHIFGALYGWEPQSGSDDQFLDLAFTQEWPLFSQTHQLSYTVFYDYARTAGQSDNGFGDVLLNYRYQAYFNPDTLLAFAPRASLILPTGDEDLGFGEDSFGLQFNLPVSAALSDNWSANFNAGLTLFPEAASAQDRTLLHYHLGGSIIYAHSSDLHFLVEWLGLWNEFGDPGRDTAYEFSSVISPGFRKAFNFSSGAQLVTGLAVPIGLTSSAPDIGVFLYLSFEHRFTRSADEP